MLSPLSIFISEKVAPRALCWFSQVSQLSEGFVLKPYSKMEFLRNGQPNVWCSREDKRQISQDTQKQLQSFTESFTCI